MFQACGWLVWDYAVYSVGGGRGQGMGVVVAAGVCWWWRVRDLDLVRGYNSEIFVQTIKTFYGIVLQMYYICVTMKGNPISIRFDKDDLILAQNLSGIKKPQKLVDLLISEYVKPLKGSAIELPKDFMNVTKVGVIDSKGVISELKFNPKIAVTVKTAIHELKKEEILKQISDIEKEKIPKERGTVLGRKVWAAEQCKKIQELKKLL